MDIFQDSLLNHNYFYYLPKKRRIPVFLHKNFFIKKHPTLKVWGARVGINKLF